MALVFGLTNARQMVLRWESKHLWNLFSFLITCVCLGVGMGMWMSL